MRNDTMSRFAAGLTLLVCLSAGSPARAQDAVLEAPAAAEVPEANADLDDTAGIGAAADAAPADADADADAAVDEGDDLWGEEQAPRDPTMGVIRGRVSSRASGDALIEARVTVQGTSFSALTDVEGFYELELPPGTYSLRVWYELHQPQRVEGVAVEAGAEQTVDVALQGDEDAVVEVVVEAEADRSRAAVQLEKRRRAPVVMDAVSGEEMAKTPDSSAADAMKRVVGATIVDGKYLVVRGLGGRYTQTLLQGVPVPSPEPDLAAVPLDLFPSSLLSSVTVAKTATPDLPGNFAGGALLIDSKQYPSAFELDLKAGFSGDSVSTFERGPRYTGSSTDWLGFDDGLRDLPATLPADGPAGRGDMSRAERNAIGESFSRTWGTRQESLPGNMTFGASVGDTVTALGNRMGYLASASWGQSWDLEEEVGAESRTDGSLYEPERELAAIRKVKLGGLGALSYQPSPSDDLSFVTLYTRSSDDRAQQTLGTNTLDGDYERTQLAYIARQLSFNQLRGHHRFDSLGRLELDWQGNFSLVNRDEPNTRTIAYQDFDGGLRMIKEDGGEILTSGLEDRTFGGGVDLALPLGGVRPKIGAFFTRSDREYETRRFFFNAARASNETLRLGPDEIFNADTIGRDFEFEERTKQTDSYEAQAQVVAGYAMLDVSLLEPFRAVFGARFERASTELGAGSPFAVSTDPNLDTTVDRVESDVLPSVNLVYALNDRMNLRTAYAMTVARPQFRELAPTTFYDFVRRRNYVGNPDLERSLIHNADLRFEFFPGATEVLAASVFGKIFEKPIEEVIQAEGGSVMPMNAERGEVFGVELESRVGLYHLSPSLQAFGVTANLTLARSRVELDAEKKRTTTNASRPLQGQSPYALNFGLLYENAPGGTTAQLLYNVFGPRIDAVGFNGRDDTYERAFHRLDLTVTQGLTQNLDLKVGATNLLDQEEVFEVGDTEVSRLRPGIGASASLAWTF